MFDGLAGTFQMEVTLMLAAFDSETQSGLTGGVKSLSEGPFGGFWLHASKTVQRLSVSLSAALRAYSGVTYFPLERSESDLGR